MIMYNILSVCAGCQKWDMSEAGNQIWQTLADYEGHMGQTCSDYRAEGNQNQLQLQPDHGDGEWQNAPEWSRNTNNTDFNFVQALALASPNDVIPNTPSTTDDSTSMSTSTPTPISASSKSGPNVGAIAGGVVGGVVLLGAIVGLVLFLRRRKRRARDVAPSDEFLKPEYYASPPLLPAQDRGDPSYRDDIEEEPIPPMPPMSPHRLSWVGGMVGTRRRDDGSGDELPPFTQGTYIGPSPHEKGHPERRHTDETVATTTSNSHLLSSVSQPGTSERD
ncbi:hypothetical protein FRC12_018804 [Ceratobasidium sp. 428]|nr:hypothetical protein FRC12_018804 [Ceratobasidium sp. 428]